MDIDLVLGTQDSQVILLMNSRYPGNGKRGSLDLSFFACSDDYFKCRRAARARADGYQLQPQHRASVLVYVLGRMGGLFRPSLHTGEVLGQERNSPNEMPPFASIQG